MIKDQGTHPNTPKEHQMNLTVGRMSQVEEFSYTIHFRNKKNRIQFKYKENRLPQINTKVFSYVELKMHLIQLIRLDFL